MPQSIRQIQMPVDGDGATAESVNSAFREFAEWLSILQHMPFRLSEPGASTYTINLAAYNAVRGEWLIGGRNTSAGFVATMNAGFGVFQPDYQLAAEETEAWVLTAGAPLNACSALNDAAVNTSGLYCVVGNGGFIATSNDGTTWVQRTPAGGFTDDFLSVAWNGTVFCAVGENAIQTSPDGTTWTARTPGSAFAGNFNSVRWDGTAFIACGNTIAPWNGEIQTSPDGITWTRRVTAVTDTILSAVACSSTDVLVVGRNSGGTDPVMRRSTDHGATWTTPTVPAVNAREFTGAGYCSSSDLFCIAGHFDNPDTKLLILMGHPSTENWALIDEPAGVTGIDAFETRAVGSDGRRFLVTSDDGMVLFSSPCLARRV